MQVCDYHHASHTFPWSHFRGHSFEDGTTTFTELYPYQDVLDTKTWCSLGHHILSIPLTTLLYEFCFLWFTNCVLLSDDNSLIPGCLWLWTFVLNNTLILGIWCSTIPHLPGCFCPWTFFPNIGFNMVPSDPFLSHLATQLFAGEFQALQLIVLATFGVVD